MPDHVPSTRLYHKHLKPPDNWCEVPDSIGGRISGDTLIRDSNGAWQWEPQPAEPTPGLAAQPVEYAPVAETTAAGDGYENFTVDQLKAELRDRELPTTGNKDELVDRLLEDDTKPEEG